MKNKFESSDPIEAFSLVVHSHLQWDWVWQRPQQFITRLSHKHPVLFIETSITEDNSAVASQSHRHLADYPNIFVLNVQFPRNKWNDAHFVDAQRVRLVREFIESPLGEPFANPVQWFYDPMAVTAFAGKMNEIATVYDCMDELSKFKGAPQEMVDREKILLEKADVVFAGGQRLYESKRRLNSNCFFYGCGVDTAHFAKARNLSKPSPLAHLPAPVLGYIGVIDERLDYQLLADLADANKEWSIVMIGPVIKVSESSLPRRPNLHWLGGKAYTELPDYGGGFDLCLMPFALNESTEFINPTKSMEYAAMAKPIVSTAILEFVERPSDFISVANSHADFIAKCRESLANPDQQAIARGLSIAEKNTWDSIVDRLEGHILDVLNKKLELV